MAKRKEVTPGTRRLAQLREQERAAAKRALQHNIRTEKLIQRLARQLNREVQRTNDRLQQCAVSLGSYARALEAERDTDRALGESEK